MDKLDKWNDWSFAPQNSHKNQAGMPALCNPQVWEAEMGRVVH